MTVNADKVTVACCQVALEFGEVATNLATLRGAVQAAAERGAQVVVLPELASTGYRFESQDEIERLAEPADGPTVRQWCDWAAEHQIVLVAGFAERADDGRIHNSAVLVDPTGVRAVYRKAHLWDRESEWFVPGVDAPPVVDTSMGRLGVMVCYDLEFPEWVRLPALAGAELLCAPVNWPYAPHPEGERPSEVVKAMANAATNRIFVAVCDRARTERGTAWVGGSMVVDPDGYPMTTSVFDAEGTVLAEVDLAAARNKALGDRNDVLADRRPDLYGPARTATAATTP